MDTSKDIGNLKKLTELIETAFEDTRNHVTQRNQMITELIQKGDLEIGETLLKKLKDEDNFVNQILETNHQITAIIIQSNSYVPLPKEDQGYQFCQTSEIEKDNSASNSYSVSNNYSTSSTQTEETTIPNNYSASYGVSQDENEEQSHQATRVSDKMDSSDSEDNEAEELLTKSFKQNIIYMKKMKDFSLAQSAPTIQNNFGVSEKQRTLDSEINFYSSDEENEATNETIIDFKNQNMDQLEQIVKITDAFHTISATYAKMIVAEKHLSLKDKKIKPLETEAGVAGGKKFIIHDMFFKFPEDKNVGSSWLYGSAQQNDRIAGKATNHELKGLTHLINADEKRIFNYPMVVLIDYQGYRQTILIQIPIDQNSLKYGSSDGGRSFHWEEELHSYLMAQSSKLKLREHQVKETGKTVMLCTDIEIHRLPQLDKEEQVYVLDYARILPPTDPANFGNSIFFRLMRAELLKEISFQISSDSYSSFQCKEESSFLNTFSHDATQFLLNKIKKIFSDVENSLEFLSMEDIQYIKNTKPQYSSIQPKDYFTRKLHQNGINLRYLGKIVVLLLKMPDITENQKGSIDEQINFLFSLITTRILKNLWKKEVQENTKENVYDFSLLSCLNLINNFCNNRESIENEILKMLSEIFMFGILDYSEQSILKNAISLFLKEIKDIHYIILRFTQICGIEPNKAVYSSLLRKTEISFNKADIHNFISIMKPLPMVTYFYALYFICSAKKTEIKASKFQFLLQSLIYIEYTLGFDFQTDLFKKLHSFVSFEIMKYNQKHNNVHWSNLLDIMDNHSHEFESFVGVPPRLAKIWKFYQSPILNTLEQPEHKKLKLFSPHLTEFLDLFKDYAYSFLKDCFEYFFEKEQYATTSQKNPEKRKSEWNTLLKNITIPEFVNKLECEKRILKLNIHDIQNWDIDPHKKEILLFTNQYYLISYFDEIDVGRKNDNWTKGLFGNNSISKSLLFEYHTKSQNSIPKRELIRKMFLLNFTKNIKDELFERNIGFSKVKYTLYLLIFPNELHSHQFHKQFQLLEDESSFDLVWKPKTIEIEEGMDTLDLSDCRIGDVEIPSILEFFGKQESITSINLQNNRIGTEGVQSISEYLKSNTTVTSIDLTYNEIQKEGAQFLIECLKSNSTLTSIDLEDHIGIFINTLAKKMQTFDLSEKKIGDEEVQFIFECLKSNSTITSVNLSNNDMTNEGAQFISECLKVNFAITLINISNNQIEEEGAQYISESLKFNTQVTSIDLSNNQIRDEGAQFISECLKANSTITSLNLKNNQIGENGAKFLSESLASNSTITSINLSSNKVGKEGALFLSDCLKTNSSITSINLTNLKIGKEGTQLISNCLKLNSTITSIYLEDNQMEKEGAHFISDCLKVNSTITSINLAGNDIGDEGVLFIAECLKSNSSITSINLQRNGIAKTGVKFISESLKLNSKINTILLSNNEIGHEGAQFLSDCLKTNPAITTITLSNNKIEKEGAQHLSECLKLNSTITSITLDMNDIGDKGAQLIGESLKTNSTLTAIDLGWNSIGNEGANFIVECLKSNSTITSIPLEDNNVGKKGLQLILECLQLSALKNKK